MPTVEKIIEKMKTSPNSITPRELERVVFNKGFYIKRQRGSHIIYVNDENSKTIVIPKHNPINECYIEETLKKIGEQQ
ncbi:MAG: type II toxin-antitoxin system HicA family toxin [Clostridiales bacterium]|nr:type II toxin-antitoxin system HicA family toxin [Candidatus Crickella equi]